MNILTFSLEGNMDHIQSDTNSFPTPDKGNHILQFWDEVQLKFFYGITDKNRFEKKNSSYFITFIV